ncbi:MAG: hypothetical protein ACM3X6_01420 [Patescibacteria group bacterium]
MGIRLGVVGVGQAGGNIAAEFGRLGHEKAAINLSSADLRSIEDQIPARLSLESGAGAAKDPAEGFRALERNAQRVMEFLRQQFAECQAILVSFSLGGGTGSGAGPGVVDLAANVFPGRPVGAIVVLPATEEAIVAQENAVEAFADLSRVRAGAVMVVDNQRAFELLRVEKADAGRRELFEATNGTVARLVHDLLQVPSLASELGNVDEAEVLALLAERGLMVIGEAILPNGGPANSADTATLVQYSLEKGVFVPAAGRATKAAVIWQAPADWTRHLRIPEVLDPLPGEVFEGIYDDSRGRILTVLTGLPWPLGRLHDIESRLEASRSAITEATAAAQTMDYSPRVSPVLSRRGAAADGDEVSVEEILGRHRRRR